VPPGDPERLANVLSLALENRASLKAMGETARQYAADNFSWLDSARKLLATYEELW
jgi:glycosyltransferase involved in cell wall biosynthesis